MKLNKKKLIALGLSALMCVSPLSSVAFAEELSDGSAEEVVVEELAAEEIEAELPIAEDAKENSVSAGFTWNDSQSTYVFVKPGDPAYTAKDGKVYAAEDEAYCVFNLYAINGTELGTSNWLSVRRSATKYGIVTVNCGKDGGYQLTSTLSYGEGADTKEKTVTSDFIVTDKATGAHNKVEKERKINKYPTCTDIGSAFVIWDCTICGEHFEGNVDLPALGHDWVAEKAKTLTEYDKDDKNLNPGSVTGTLHYAKSFDGKEKTVKDVTVAITNTKLTADGEVVLVDPQQDGYYAVLVHSDCSRCNATKNVYDIYEILAETSYYEVVTDQKGIATALKDKPYDATNPIFKTENIELSDCTVAGSYVVTTYANEIPVNIRTITVPAHHMETRIQIEFDKKSSKTVKDTVIADQFTVVYTKDGYKITNNHCTDSFVYYEVVHCTAAGCPSRFAENQSKYVLANLPTKPDVITVNGINLYEKHLDDHVVSRTPIVKTADGNHLINKAAKKEIDDFYNEGKNKAFNYATLKANYVDKYSDVKIGEKGNVDEEHDYVIVEYYCNLCGKYHEDAKYLVPHAPKIPVEENRVESTCITKGSYDAVTYCDICGKELNRRHMNLPLAKHENQTVVYGKPNTYQDDLSNSLGLPVQFGFVGKVVVSINGKNGKAGVNGNTIVKGFKINGNTYRPGEAVSNAAYVGQVESANVQQDYCVTLRAYTDCSVCNNHKIDVNPRAVTIEVVDVSENSFACNPGSITLKATYKDSKNKEYTIEQTFPYFTAINDYQARADHKPGKPQVETINGNKYTVTRCSVCGTPLDQEAVEPEKTDLTVSDVNVVLGQTVKALVGTNSTGELTYTVENEEIATVDAEGVIRGVNYGSTTVKVALAAKDNWEAKEATFTVTVRPQPTVIWQLRDEGAGTMVVRWRTIEGVDGVQFAYATDADFGDAKYSVWTASNTQRRYGLESATYYVKARTYVLGEDGKRIYSTWCSPKSISLGRYLPAPASMFCNVKSNGSVEFTVSPSAKAEGYQISYTDAAGNTLTSSAATATFTRKLGTGSFDVAVRAYAYAEDGKYYSEWVPAGTVTIQ